MATGDDGAADAAGTHGATKRQLLDVLRGVGGGAVVGGWRLLVCRDDVGTESWHSCRSRRCDSDHTGLGRIADDCRNGDSAYCTTCTVTDADVDGAHIRTLLLTLLYRHFRPIIEGGFVYIAQPPLYKITKGKTVRYAYSDNEKEKTLKDLGAAATDIVEIDAGEEAAPEEAETEEAAKKAKGGKVNVQRYKGLGEMNPGELWETTMDPERRVLKQVHVEDGEAADRIFDILMGTDVASRKSFIQSNAKLANLDV